MKWYDFFKVFTYSFAEDPLSRKKDKRNLSGAGVTQPDAMPDLRNADGLTAGSGAFIRVQNDLIDVQTTTSRMNRYKEYQRLAEGVAEIDRAMTVFSDEACVSGDTMIATVFDGLKPMEWLVKHKAGDRFPVYCFNFERGDYTIGWAFDPRHVKDAETVKLYLDDGSYEVVTPDHRILRRDTTWVQAGQLREGDELMPFYRLRPPHWHTTKFRTRQFPRIYTHLKGWVHERQFIDEWRLGKDLPQYERVNKACRMISGGLTCRKIAKLMKHDWHTVEDSYQREGFSFKEIRYLSTYKPDRRRVIGIERHKLMPVYDLSVEKYENFCTSSTVMHNCQKNEDGRIFKLECNNKEVTSECDYLFFHREMLNFNQRTVWDKFRRLCIKGDAFWEIVIDPEDPKNGIVGIQDLQPETMFRIETTKGRLIEFQQSREGPDYKAIENTPIETASDSELAQANAIRFSPKQIVHIRLGDYRKTFYPYGVSLIEPARGPAHQLRMMEDAMVVYRLCIRTYDKIKVPTGWKFMRDISIGDTVYSYNPESSKLEKAEVIWHQLVGKRAVYKVRSKHTSVTGTDLHPILAFDTESGVTDYVKIKDLTPGVHCFLRPLIADFKVKRIDRFYKEPFATLNDDQRKKYSTGRYADKKALIIESLKEAGEAETKQNIQKCWSFLCSSDHCSLPAKLGSLVCEKFGLGEPLRKNKGERNPARINLPTFVTKDFAALFGFLLGDGCISWHQRSSKLLFAAGQHQEINETYSSLLKQYFGYCKFQQDKRLVDGLGNYCVNSKTACEILQNLGYTGDAHTKRIPGWVFEERPEIRKAFVKGFADADGSKRGMGQYPWNTTIRLCNRELVEDIKEVWESLGYHASEVKKINEPERLIKDQLVPAGTGWEVYLSETEVPFHDEIVSITEEGMEDVWDLTVEYDKEHNFLCNGVPVSNTRAPERRVFYIDVGQLPPFKAEAFMDRLKDQFRKKKVVRNNNSASGASAVEEKWHPPAQDEDYWLPLRPNSNTRIETLPGAQNLGEIDDTVYFRNKLFTALNFPPNYFANEDPNSTRITLSAQNVQFAMLIERLQSYFEEAVWEVADRHLTLRGFPPECYEDLKIKMTAPSDWREMSRAEVVTNRINNANSIKGSQLMSDFDTLTKWMKYTEDEAKEMISRNKVQKLEDLKLQVLAQNPQLLGVGIPGQGEQEIGAEPGGPSPTLGGEQMPGGPPGGEMPGGPPGGGGGPPVFSKDEPSLDTGPSMMPPEGQGKPLPEPSEEEILKYDLEIEDYESEQDEEDIDYSELER